ncbi:12057_t:CDS:2, partial [Gigaspora margarita]
WLYKPSLFEEGNLREVNDIYHLSTGKRRDEYRKENLVHTPGKRRRILWEVNKIREGISRRKDSEAKGKDKSSTTITERKEKNIIWKSEEAKVENIEENEIREKQIQGSSCSLALLNGATGVPMIERSSQKKLNKKEMSEEPLCKNSRSYFVKRKQKASEEEVDILGIIKTNTNERNMRYWSKEQKIRSFWTKSEITKRK